LNIEANSQTRDQGLVSLQQMIKWRGRDANFSLDLSKFSIIASISILLT
jgi:hypothetical protein